MASSDAWAAKIDEMIETVEGRMTEYEAIVRRLRSVHQRDEAAILKWDHRWDEARWACLTLKDIRDELAPQHGS